MKYRSEIDGLRALAVLPVVLYHAGAKFISGGFLGVDVFFVISGYLITSIIVHDLNKQRFSIAIFYERRARRILPALLVMMVAVIVSGFVLLSPTDLKDLSQSVFATIFFASNIYFYMTSGYFSPAADELPLLHTWSLAVEEQYYIIFPLLLMFFWKKGVSIRVIIYTVSAIAITSFVASYFIAALDTSANFYLLTSRAWELLAGALLALNYKYFDKSGQKVKEVMAAIGLILLLLCYALFSNKLPHPSWPTLFPVLATFCILAYSRNTLVGKLLSTNILVYFGAISYSLYLWHQPIFAFVRIKDTEEFSLLLATSLVFLTIILSHLTLKYVETPFRNRQFLDSRSIYKLSISCIVIFSLLGLGGHFTEGVKARFDDSIDFDSISISPKRYQCHTSGINYLHPDQACNLFDEKPSVAVLGDSHGVELSYMFGHYLKKYERSLLQLTFSGCPPAIDFDTTTSGCKQWLRESIIYIIESDEIDTVILTFRHTAYLSGDNIEASNQQAFDVGPSHHIENSEGLSVKELKNIYYSSFEALVNELISNQKKVVIIGPIPELKSNIKKIITPFSIFNNPVSGVFFETDWVFQNNRSGYINKWLITLSSSIPMVTYLNSNEPFCDDRHCLSVIDGKSMYFDDDHLSLDGSKRYISFFDGQFNKLFSNMAPDNLMENE
ncbi:acyltransferase family protein [Colwellia echini]|uniref:Acyltransferase n=1 Tax=Colwellia echini TaxID=1982103 RepID=A0ABY3MX31_9GAMM|nr:acyltransferase family protein [Colwellia echini]TYK65760.1 acyltransferase [Colwellia echini]